MTRARAKGDSLRLRVLSSVVGTPLVTFLVWLSPVTTAALVAIASAIGIAEFCRMSPSPVAKPILALAVLGGVLFAVNAGLGGEYTAVLVTSAIVLPLLAMVLMRPAQRSPLAWAWSVAGMLYIGWTLSLVVLLRVLPDGREWVLAGVGITFAVDTAAYFIGKAFGHRSLAPSISPGKTWEGAIAGFLAGGIAAVLLTYALGLAMPWWQTLVLGLLVGVAAQIGDLAESMIKRFAGTKDAGGLVPGHGGFFDRLDSLIPSYAVVYFFVSALG